MAGRPPSFDHAAAVELYTTTDLSMEKIAARFDVVHQAVQQVVRKYAPDFKKDLRKGPPPSYDREAAVALLAEGGRTQKEVAALFNVSPSTLHSAVKQQAPHLLDRKHSPTFNVDEAMKLIQAGETFAAVSARFGVSMMSIHRQWRKRHPDVKLKTGPRPRKTTP